MVVLELFRTGRSIYCLDRKNMIQLRYVVLNKSDRIAINE